MEKKRGVTIRVSLEYYKQLEAGRKKFLMDSGLGR